MVKNFKLPISLSKLSRELRASLTDILSIVTFLDKAEPDLDRRLHFQDLQASARSLLSLVDRLSSLSTEFDIKQHGQDSVDLVHSKARILLVEDSPVLQIVCKKMLWNLGFFVEIAQSGEEALNKVDAHAYKLIFMDIGLPGMNGIEAATAIRQLSSAKKTTPIVALTSFYDQKIHANCLQAGINTVAYKPIKQEKLSKLVAYYCQEAGMAKA